MEAVFVDNFDFLSYLFFIFSHLIFSYPIQLEFNEYCAIIYCLHV